MNNNSLEEAVEQLCASVTNEYNKRTPQQDKVLSVQFDHENGTITIPTDNDPIYISIDSLDPYLLTVDTSIEEVEFGERDRAATFAINHHLNEE